MHVPYLLDPDRQFTRQAISPANIPEWCKYPLAFATQRTLYTHPEMELLSQQVIHDFFQLDLLQLRTNQANQISFEIYNRQLFLYFALGGSVLYLTERKRPVIHTNANSYLMSYFTEGRYLAYTEKGMYIALVVSILPPWIETIFINYPHLRDILDRYKSGLLPYDTMYQGHISRRIHRWLYKIYSHSQSNIGVLDGNLRKYFSYLLEHYDSISTDVSGDLAFKIKTYIQEHFRDQELSVAFLANYFFIPPRTMLYNFSHRYHQSIQEYITGLRISYALKLMTEQGIGIKDVYMEAGYKDERSFRYAFDRYMKRP